MPAPGKTGAVVCWDGMGFLRGAGGRDARYSGGRSDDRAASLGRGAVTVPDPGLEPDTTDLRTGPPLNDQLLALLPLVGVWRGVGTGAVASNGDEFSFGQQVSFSHDGRPFLVYESRTWLIDAAGDLIRLAFRESGFWRPGRGHDDVEAQIATAAGIVEIFTGVAGDNRWELATAELAHTPTARLVVGERRLYGLVGDQLAYATELHVPEVGGFAPHLSAQLTRI